MSEEKENIEFESARRFGVVGSGYDLDHSNMTIIILAF